MHRPDIVAGEEARLARLEMEAAWALRLATCSCTRPRRDRRYLGRWGCRLCSRWIGGPG